MEQLRITTREAATKPNYRKMSGELLKWCREFYQDPENEKAFQEWKAGKDGRRGRMGMDDRRVCGG